MVAQKQELLDVTFYEKMWSLDKDLAKTFIEKRLSMLNKTIDETKGEVKNLEKILRSDEDREIENYLKSRPAHIALGISAEIVALMSKSKGVGMKPAFILRHLEKNGHKGINIASINNAIAKLYKEGKIKKISWGVYMVPEDPLPT